MFVYDINWKYVRIELINDKRFLNGEINKFVFSLSAKKNRLTFCETVFIN
jgi:hypothetical protein